MRIRLTLVTLLAATIPQLHALHAATVTDKFSTAHDYSGGNVSGTIWSGTLNAGNATSFNTTTAVGNLYIGVNSAANTGYDGTHRNAPFLYLNVTGDFTSIVQSTGGSLNNYSENGLLLYADNTNFLQTRFFHPGTGSFDSFRTVIGGTQTDNNFMSLQNTYLEISRTGSLYTSAVSSNGTTWTTLGTYNATSGPLSNATQMIGLDFGNYAGSTTSFGQFDNFSLTTPVPEPSEFVLLGVSAAALLISAVRRRGGAAVI